MGSSTLFIISTLALLGAAAAQYCTTAYFGSTNGEPRPFQEITVPAGPNTVFFPNPCSPLYEIGLKVTACSAYPPPSVVQATDQQHAYVDSHFGARVDAVAYCGYYSVKPAQGGLKPADQHHSRIMFATNQFL